MAAERQSLTGKYESRSKAESVEISYSEPSRKMVDTKLERVASSDYFIADLQQLLSQPEEDPNESIVVEQVDDSESLQAVMLPLHHFDPQR